MKARWLVAAALLVAACGSVPTASEKPSYVPWVALPAQHHYVEAPLASQVPPIPIPAGTRACQASQLEGVNIGMSGATGNVNMPLLFRNRGSSDCYLEGYPDAAVLAPNGSVLAAGSGATGRGTFFDDGPVVQVMLKAGTPALPSPGPGYTPPLGEAFMNFSWYACTPLQANRLALDLPDAGGRLVIPFDMRAYFSAACDGSSSYPPAVFRGPFSPTGVEWPPGYDYLSVTATIGGLTSVQRGKTLVYYVTLRNTSDRDYLLTPCPDYAQFIGPKLGIVEYQLNCGPVAPIRPGRAVTFEMKFTVPSTAGTGISSLNWSLNDGRLGGAYTRADIEITS